MATTSRQSALSNLNAAITRSALGVGAGMLVSHANAQAEVIRE